MTRFFARSTHVLRSRDRKAPSIATLAAGVALSLLGLAFAPSATAQTAEGKERMKEFFLETIINGDENRATAIEVLKRNTQKQEPLATMVLKRRVFRPDFFTATKLGKALVANADNYDAKKEAMVASLVDAAKAGAQLVPMKGGAMVEGMAGAAVEGGIDMIGGAFSDAPQLARLAKNSTDNDTYLVMDGGSWCLIPNGNALSALRADKLDVMVRADIQADSTAPVCRWPDGFYKHNANATAYFLYSTSDSDPAWYGIGFGAAYCAIPNEAMWQELAKVAHPEQTEFNVRQPTLFRPADINSTLSGRTDKGVCTGAEREAAAVNVEQIKPARMVFYPNHYRKTGHGSMLRTRSQLPPAPPFNMMSAEEAMAMIEVMGGEPFLGTKTLVYGARWLAQKTPQLTQMYKRSNSAAVYLHFDDRSSCYLGDVEAFKRLKAEEMAPSVTDDVPSYIQPDTVRPCGWPDGFYKSDTTGDQVYFAFSSSKDNPTWYGIGFGDSYCRLSNEVEWRNAGSQVGGNWKRPQESLQRVYDTRFLLGRREVQCPAMSSEGVAIRIKPLAKETPIQCAFEGQLCVIDKPRTIVYGSPGRTETFARSLPFVCSNDLLFADPAPGTPKSCSIAAEAPAPVEPCASEGGECQFGGLRTVFYGANGRGVERLFAGGVGCNNNIMGKDPAPGVAKTCTLLMPAAVQCATENQSCAFTGYRTVIYGVPGRTVSKLMAGPILCTNTVMGQDPAPGVAKACSLLP